ncbi:anti-sigma factor [uncultured Thiothrix sp.]|uniref:anti-sigma factor n=1 Tax=uncultured Thiothrix sp. TaxID=223185 RepID=UPI002606535E|nr:anti-sigma factor [uncultured Thiothrix sp.]
MNWKQVLNKYHYVLITGILLILLLLGFQAVYRWWIPNPSALIEGTAQEYVELKQQEHTKAGSWLRTLNVDMQAVQGDLLWNSERQAGMLRLKNLPNPKAGYQYHLWAYDSHRPSDQPISILVLDRGSGQQEWYLPLTASEPMPSPYKFELTLEPVDTLQTANPLVLLMVQF